jgi:hypothetical protein
MSNLEERIAVVDGREALAYVIVRPNADGTGVIMEAAANGLSKGEGAVILRHIADYWEAGQQKEDEEARALPR